MTRRAADIYLTIYLKQVLLLAKNKTISAKSNLTNQALILTFTPMVEAW